MMLASIPTAKPYFDQRIKCETVFVMPGQHFVQRSGPGAICTLLGSCVSACIRDTSSPAGGLNHFLLPEGAGSEKSMKSARYGVHAMELLINDLITGGSRKSDLVAKVFGGANVIATSSNHSVGMQNGTFVKEYLQSESIPILAEDLGGDRARRIYFFPATGRVSVLNVSPAVNVELEKKEQLLRDTAKTTPSSGTVELF